MQPAMRVKDSAKQKSGTRTVTISPNLLEQFEEKQESNTIPTNNSPPPSPLRVLKQGQHKKIVQPNPYKNPTILIHKLKDKTPINYSLQLKESAQQRRLAEHQNYLKKWDNHESHVKKYFER